MDGPGATVARADSQALSDQPADRRDAAEGHRPEQGRAERPGQLLGGGDRHHHQGRDQQQPDGAHRDGDADRGQHGHEQVVGADPEPGDPGELGVGGDGEELGEQAEGEVSDHHGQAGGVPDLVGD